MDPDTFSASLFKWDTRGVVASPAPPPQPQPPPPSAPLLPPPPPPVQYGMRHREIVLAGGGGGGLEEFFQEYGIRYYTAAKIGELGFTVSTLLDMKDEELDDMMTSLSQIFRWDLLIGERYGIKAAVRAERRRIEEEEIRRRHLLAADSLDALSQEGLSEEPVQQQDKEAAGSGGGGGTWEIVPTQNKRQRRRRTSGKLVLTKSGDYEEEEDENAGRYGERQREHPFIVTEPGEVARGKKNGLDYLFHLYEQCREFLIQVQNIAKERGEKCPTKVTNQVFRYAKKAGASYINKPKMRHYVHCYALHCLDEDVSNALRRDFKARGENVGAWRQACYRPLVSIASRHGWDIDGIFNTHPRLSIWYVPTKLRQLCHAERSSAATAATSSSVSGGGGGGGGGHINGHSF